MEIKEFSLGKYHVDVLRNQISSEQTTHNLPPKAIAVLCVLAEHQGQVVSFETIMEQVWQDTVVTPNTLQRNISQLRKVLANSHHQQVIKTHSKKGYSLEVPVIKNSSISATANQSRQSNSLIAWISCLMILVLLTTWGFHRAQSSKQTMHQFTHYMPLTSSDLLESSASYDPKGEFIAFQRHLDNCNSHIWLKELSSHKEWQLTAEKGVYGKVSWSVDGNHLTFTERNTCKLSVKADESHDESSNQSANESTDEFCWNINTLDLLDAMAAPQQPTRRVECQNNPAWLAKWLPDGRISFLTEKNGLTSIQTFTPKTASLESLLKGSNDYIYTYDYSPVNSTLAVISLNNKSEHALDIIDVSGERLSSAIIVLPKRFPRNNAFVLNYHPSGEYLVISAANKVFKLAFDGEVETLNMGGNANLSDLSLHPDGRSFIATEVIADTDNVLLSMETSQQQTVISDLTPYRFARSNLGEDKPTYQPNGEVIAFTSTRSGTRQIWLFDNNEVHQLSKVQSGMQSKDIAWSPSGKKLAGIFDNKLHIWHLTGTHIKVDSILNVDDILHWYSSNEILVNARIDGHLYLHILNIKTNTMTQLDKKNILWANYTDNGQLIYLDNQSQFWLEQGTTEYALTQLKNQLEQPIAAYYQDKLYGINKQRELWEYSISDDQLTSIVILPESSRYLSDFNGTDFLITHMQNLKKDVILIKRSL